jgi:hypothetical protein
MHELGLTQQDRKTTRFHASACHFDYTAHIHKTTGYKVPAQKVQVSLEMTLTLTTPYIVACKP